MSSWDLKKCSEAVKKMWMFSRWKKEQRPSEEVSHFRVFFPLLPFACAALFTFSWILQLTHFNLQSSTMVDNTEWGERRRIIPSDSAHRAWRRRFPTAEKYKSSGILSFLFRQNKIHIWRTSSEPVGGGMKWILGISITHISLIRTVSLWFWMFLLLFSLFRCNKMRFALSRD